MSSPFWHTQHGVSSPLWQTPQRAPRRPDRPERPDRPDRPRRPERPDRPDIPSTTQTTREANAPARRTKADAENRLPVPSSRPPILSRYTSPEDEPRTAPVSMLPRRSSGSPGRVYSSPTRPYDECHSPVMTLRILSPSRHGARDEKQQDGQENRPSQPPAELPALPQGLNRSTNTKLTPPKRRRLPLRDSILLKRNDSAGSSAVTTPTTEIPSRQLPVTPDPREEQTGHGSLPPTPTTPCKSRLKGLPRLGTLPRDSKIARPSEPRQTEPPAGKKKPLSSKRPPTPFATEDTPDTSGNLVSRICTMILDEGVGAGGDRSSIALKVWEAVAKCLDEMTQASRSETIKQPLPDSASSKTPQKMLAPEPKLPASKSPWPPESWGLREKETGHDKRPAGEAPRELTADALSQLAKAEHDQPTAKETSAPKLPCPFRARNPARFNVNDRWHCAQGQWKNLFELQQHIARHHRHPSDSHLFQCPRCEKGFSEPNAFKEHLMLPREQMCDPRAEVAPPTSDPEDGITAGRARALSEGVERGKIGSWDDLWKCLFPTDKMVPRPAILPAIELPQVEQEVFAGDNMSSLKAGMEERLKFLASQSADSDMFLAQIPVITGSISLVVEAHLRSVFIACRTQLPTFTPRTRSASQTQASTQALAPETVTNRPRKLSSVSGSSAKVSDKLEYRRPAIHESKSFARDTFNPRRRTQRSISEGSPQNKIPRATNLATLPVPSTLTIPFPRISALTEQSDAAPSNVSDEGNTSPKGRHSDADYSSGVESNPTSAGGLRDSSNTDIRCSKCNMRPSLRPNEDVFSEARLSGSVRGTHDSSCRFSDSGIGILCRNCRMLEELINSYSRASSQSAKSERRPGEGRPGGDAARKGAEQPARRAPFSPDPSVSVDENDEETLFDLILDSATYLDEDGQRKTQPVSPMFPPPRQDLPPGGAPKYDRYGHDGGFF